MNRLESLTRVGPAPWSELAPGVQLQMLATGELGAQGLTTALANFQPGAALTYHTHPCSEVVMVLDGYADILVEGRRYRLSPLDALHIPAETAHSTHNPALERSALLHTSFGAAAPTRDWVSTEFREEIRAASMPTDPEHLVRFAAASTYELAVGTSFRDLFARRLGARGICGGHGLFQPGAALPCHTHGFDESITIIAGVAVCQVAGQEYELSGYGTACIPKGRPHRFLNRGAVPMAMIWVYAGAEPDRMLVPLGNCDGKRSFNDLTVRDMTSS